MLSEHNNDGFVSKYLDTISKIIPICDEEFEYLFKKFKKGDEKAKKRLIEGNFKFVVTVASKYQNMGMSLMDLIEEGNIGIIKAIEKFDNKKGVKFSTYAIWWIKQRIKRALDYNASIVRIPSNVIQNVRKCINYWEEVLKDDIKKDFINQTSKDLDLTFKEIKNAMYCIDIFKNISSLDVPIADDESISLADTLLEETNNPEKILEKEMNVKIIRNILEKLTDKEKFVIISRFGLNGNKEKTLNEIGLIMGLSKESVRQIANKAMTRMKRSLEKNIYK